MVHYDTTVDSVVSGSTVVDVSGNGINGTLTNGAAYSSTDRALTFDGTGMITSKGLNNPSSLSGNTHILFLDVGKDQYYSTGIRRPLSRWGIAGA